jgi:hypothetical protein
MPDGTRRDHQHRRCGRQVPHAADEVEELLHSHIRAEAAFGDCVVGAAQGVRHEVVGEREALALHGQHVRHVPDQVGRQVVGQDEHDVRPPRERRRGGRRRAADRGGRSRWDARFRRRPPATRCGDEGGRGQPCHTEHAPEPARPGQARGWRDEDLHWIVKRSGRGHQRASPRSERASSLAAILSGPGSHAAGSRGGGAGRGPRYIASSL